ncbi:unnamed protein product, partial [Didymodactylos carnosus]
MQDQKRISVSDGLIVVNDHKFKVEVYNVSTSPVTLQQNMHLRTISRLSVNTYFSTMMEQAKMPANDLTRQENQTKFCETTSISTTIDSLVHHLGQSNQRQQIKSILEDYSSLFDTTTPRKVLTPIHHVIDTGDHSSVTARPYFKTIQQRKDIQNEIDKMLKSGIVVPSHSSWSSPVILLKKPNGEFRFIVDYRKLNSITKKDAYPQPTTEELLQRLGGHKWFTKLDLKSGYFQIPIQDQDKEKTAFCTQDGLYQFEVLPMGLMNAPPTFQRVMNNIIGYNRWDYVLIYLDDIIIFSDTFEQHLQHLNQILSILNQH